MNDLEIANKRKEIEDEFMTNLSARDMTEALHEYKEEDEHEIVQIADMLKLALGLQKSTIPGEWDAALKYLLRDRVLRYHAWQINEQLAEWVEQCEEHRCRRMHDKCVSLGQHSNSPFGGES